MSWEYRVMKRRGELAIYEVYYKGDDDTIVEGYSAEPGFPAAVTIDELRKNCDRYVAAMLKPVLVYDE
jgi:hypothetical protein